MQFLLAVDMMSWLQGHRHASVVPTFSNLHCQQQAQFWSAEEILRLALGMAALAATCSCGVIEGTVTSVVTTGLFLQLLHRRILLHTTDLTLLWRSQERGLNLQAPRGLCASALLPLTAVHWSAGLPRVAQWRL